MTPLFPLVVFFAWAGYLSWTYKKGEPLYPIWISLGCFGPISAYLEYLQYQGQAFTHEQHDAFLSPLVSMIVALELYKWFQMRKCNGQPETLASVDDPMTSRRTG